MNIRIENLYKSFKDNHVLNDVSFEIPEGKILGLFGPSGGGKSVLLKVIAQVIDLDKGNINYQGLEKEDINLMFQEGALFDSLSVFDNVAFPLVDGRVPTSSLPIKKQKEVADKVMAILDRVGLREAYNKFPAQISGGMKRRASLARTLVSAPKLTLLDDPTCGLDPIASSVIMNLIVEIQKEMNSTMIIASQDLRRLFPVTDSNIALFDGSIAYQGVLESKELAEIGHINDFINCRYDLTADTFK